MYKKILWRYKHLLKIKQIYFARKVFLAETYKASTEKSESKTMRFILLKI